MKTDPILDAMIDEEVMAALRPFEGTFPIEDLDELRHMMRIVLRTHPTATHVLEQISPRASPDESGKEDVRMFKGLRARAKKVGGE